jgi:hypothetical protein
VKYLTMYENALGGALLEKETLSSWLWNKNSVDKGEIDPSIEIIERELGMIWEKCFWHDRKYVIFYK